MPSICFVGNYSHFSGALEVFRNVARYLKGQGWTTAYLYHRHRARDVQPDMAMFDHVHEVNDEEHDRDRLAHRCATFANQFDIVHTTLIPIQWRFLFKMAVTKPMVETYHSSDGWNWMKEEFKQRLAGNIERPADVTTAISMGLAKLIARDIGIQVEPIFNGIRIPDQVFHGGPYVSFCGRIAYDKGLDEWLKIADSIQRNRPGTKFQWIGSPSPDMNPNGMDLLRAGCPWLEITGFQEDTSPFYADTGCLLHTSPSEGLPMVLVEAMAHGVPAVTYNAGESRESHAIVAHNRSDAYDKVIQCLDTWTPEQAQQCQDMMREKFNLDVMGQKYLSIYRDLI